MHYDYRGMCAIDAACSHKNASVFRYCVTPNASAVLSMGSTMSLSTINCSADNGHVTAGTANNDWLLSATVEAEPVPSSAALSAVVDGV